MSVLILRNDYGTPIAVAEDKGGVVSARGLKGAGREWADWVNSRHDTSLIDTKAASARTARIEGPASIDIRLKEPVVAYRSHSVEPLLFVPIGSTDRQSRIEFKAAMFIRNTDLSTAVFEVKRGGRALWDPNLGANGGYRCPPGTRFAGRWSDQMGTNCGGFGFGRRIGNTLQGVGGSLDSLADQRGGRNRADNRRRRGIAREEGRGQRANERAQLMRDGMSPRQARRTVRLERGAARRERVADRIDQFDARRRDRGANRLERGADRRERLANRIDRFDEGRGRRRDERGERRAARLERGAARRERAADRVDQYAAGRNERRAARLDRAAARRERAADRLDRVGANRRERGADRPRQPRTGRRAERLERAAARRERVADRIDQIDVRRREASRRRRDRRADRLERGADRRDRIADRLDGGDPSPRRVPGTVPEQRPARPQLDPDRPRRPRPNTTDRDQRPNRPRRPDRPVRPAARDEDDRTPDADFDNLEPDTPAKPDAPGKPAKPKKPTPDAAEVDYRKMDDVDLDDALRRERAIVNGLDVEAREQSRERMRAIMSEQRRRRRENRQAQQVRPSSGPNPPKRVRTPQSRRSDKPKKPKPDQPAEPDYRKMTDEELNAAFDKAQVAGMRRNADPEDVARMQRIVAERVRRRRANDQQPVAPVAPDAPGQKFNVNEAERRQIRNRIEMSRNFFEGRIAAQRDDIDLMREMSENFADSIASLERQQREQLFDTNFTRAHRVEEIALMKEMKEKVDLRIPELQAKEVERAARVAAEAQQQINDPFEGEGAKLLAERVAKQRERRRKIFGKYLDDRYGPGEQPWLDPKVNIPIDEIEGLINNGSREDRDRLDQWAKNVYEHAEISGADGARFRTVDVTTNVGANWQDRNDPSEMLTVKGQIEAFNPDSGQWEKVGTFTRNVMPGTKKIYNAYMMMGNDAGPPYDTEFGEAMKGKGFQSVFNPHAFMWAKASGFKEVGVTAGGSDGPYVWGKVGFRSQNPDSYRRLARVFDEELQKFRRGDDSVIRTEDDAKIIQTLVARSNAVNHDAARAPGHAEYALALTIQGADKDERKADEEKIGEWFKSNASFSSGKIDLTDDEMVPVDPRPERRVLMPALQQNGPARAYDPRRGKIAITQDGNHAPRAIVNPDIPDQGAANDYIKNGGSLQDVPNQFWLEAIQSNSSQIVNDPNSRFRQIPKNGGRIGDTRIFLIRNPDGTTGNQGYVLKGADPGDSMNEVIGANLAAEHGIAVEGGGWDGEARGRVFAVVPHAFNNAPDGDVEFVNNGINSNYDKRHLANTPDAGMPEMLGHFLHNFSLGVSDRHHQNGMTLVVDGKPVVVAIDQGWAGKAAQYGYANTPDGYLRSQFSMHPTLFQDIKDYGNRLTPEEKTRYYDRIVGVYDGILERAERMTGGNEAEFVERMLIGVPPARNTAARVQAAATYRMYETQVQRLRQHRDATLTLLGYTV